MKIKKKEEKPQLKEAEITNEDLGVSNALFNRQEQKNTQAKNKHRRDAVCLMQDAGADGQQRSQ